MIQTTLLKFLEKFIQKRPRWNLKGGPILRYKIKEAKLDLGTTPIENIFLNNYLAIADGDSIKVYLYAYKKALEGFDGEETFEEIGQNLNLSPDTVADAFGFWEGQGIVDITSHGESFSCQFKSLRELFLGLDDLSEKPEEQKTETPEPRQILSNDGDTTFTIKEMFDGIEAIIGTSLLPNEIERIEELKKEFGQDRDLIVEGFNYSARTQNKKNVNYVLTVLRNWAIDGILTMEDLTKKRAKREEKKRTPRTRKKQSKGSKKSPDDIAKFLEQKLIEDFEKARGGNTD